MYLIALTDLRTILEAEAALPRGFFHSHHRTDWQEAQAGNMLDARLHMEGIFHPFAHHLVTAADADNRSLIFRGLTDGFCHAIVLQCEKVPDRILAAWQNDDIGLSDLVRITGIE